MMLAYKPMMLAMMLAMMSAPHFPTTYLCITVQTRGPMPNLPGRRLQSREAAVRCEHHPQTCLLYTSDAADEEDSVDLGGRRIIKKKKKIRVRRRMMDNIIIL
eukprot:TRINITY_DN4259_c0_g1_i2.p1 TRINITY_DN4259_c0_g1~~TRINITY_DN4259_c0_g1_i2.p1  ORF type:complete len:103 (+),score=9.14 TRINITY_DN4259_c0_g1_i2:33-341(+)